MKPSHLLPMLILAAACGDVQGSGTTGGEAPGLVLVDSVALREADSAYVGQPYDLEVAPDGSFLISDLFSKRVLVFGRDGSYVGGIGRAGSGPGEFDRPGHLVPGGDSLLFVLDGAELKRFDLRGRTYAGSVSLGGVPTAIDASGERIYLGQPDLQGGTSFRYTDDPGATFTAGGYLPSILHNPAVGPMFSNVALAASGDRVATAFVVTDMLYVTDLATGRADSVRVPAIRRRGVDPEVFVRMGQAPSQELAEAALASSFPVRLHWLPSGLIALVSTDSEMEGVVFLTPATQYLSLIDPATGATCVDAVVPGPTDPPVTVGFRGDTLFVLSQAVNSVAGGEAVVRSYRIEASSCGGIGQGAN